MYKEEVLFDYLKSSDFNHRLSENPQQITSDRDGIQ